MKKYRKGVFFVVYLKNKKGNVEYLLLKRKLHWVGWEFPKGGVEKKETLLETAIREIKEETGLKPIKVKKFDIHGKYSYNKPFEDRSNLKGQTFESLYSAEVEKKDVRVDEIEHSDYKWVDYNTAQKMLTWENQKKCLQVVNDWLKTMKFREHIISSGIPIWSGKNKKQNDELVKMFLGKENIIMHTAAKGSPFCVIDYLKPTKKDLQEVAIICARYSQDWKNNKSDVIVHVFKGKHVKKEKNMPIGTFAVKKLKKLKIKKEEIKKIQNE